MGSEIHIIVSSNRDTRCEHSFAIWLAQAC